MRMPTYTARQLENLARQQADKIEALARGDAMLDKQIDALRAASEAAGPGVRIPSARAKKKPPLAVRQHPGADS